MRFYLLAAASVCFSLSSVLCSVPVAAASGTIALPDCNGKPVVKPASVILACADGGVVAGHVTWNGWGAAVAGGTGVASVNDCDPNCAAGHQHNYTIMLHAAGRQRCPNGQTAYARVSYAWVGKTPYGAGTTTIQYPCGHP
jgi:hypothetical protein